MTDPSGFNTRLRRDRFARVPFGADRALLNRSAEAFLRFLALPDTVKRQLHFPARSERASADGFTDKSAEDRKDPKQFFHWSPWLLEQPVSQKLAAEHATVRQFLDAGQTLYQVVEATLFDLFNRNLPDYRDLVFEEGRLRDGILRFLCYAPRPDHSFGARGHFDKGFSTLAIADSAQGLRIGCCGEHELTPVRHRDGEALFMPAWMLHEASDGAIAPAWHDVVHAPGEPDVNEICARWSIVFFVNYPGKAFSSWDDLHRPLADHAAQ